MREAFRQETGTGDAFGYSTTSVPIRAIIAISIM
jgi:hypothetical protein